MLVLFTSFAFGLSANGQQHTEFCFKRSVTQEQFQQAVSVALKPTDKIHQNESGCFEMDLTQDREKLFTILLEKKLPLGQKSHYRESVSSRNDQPETDRHCYLELTSKEKVNNSERKIGTEVIAAQHGDSFVENQTQMVVTSEKSAVFQAFGQSFRAKCLLSPGGQRADLEINLDGVASSVISSISLNKGVEFDLGQVLKNRQEEKNHVDLNTGGKSTLENTKIKETSDLQYKILLK